jgi:elongation factor 1-beta
MVVSMADVILTLKVMPQGTEVDLDKLEATIKKEVRADRIVREPIAFGLVALNVTTIIQDAAGELDSVEEKVRSLEGVGEVEITEVTRTL